MSIITLNQLTNLELVEGAQLYNRFADRASDEIYDNLLLEEVIESVRTARVGYQFNAGKYNNSLQTALVVDYRGHRYALGVSVEGNTLVVRTFLNEGQVEYSLGNSGFANFYL